MISLLQSILLGILQGITEWLPVSSSGHLVMAQHLFGIDPPVLFDVSLHCGTLAALLVFFRRDVLHIMHTVFTLDFAHDRMPLYIVVGSLPTAVIGFLLHDFFVSLFNVRMVGISLLITGIVLFSARERGKRGIDVWDAFLVGVAQGVSIAPGISRSGATIACGLWRGVERNEAMRFSFLLSIPAVVGAMAFEGYRNPSEIALLPSIAGMVAAALVGYLSLEILSRIVGMGKVHYFSLYCFAMGFFALLVP